MITKFVAHPQIDFPASFWENPVTMPKAVIHIADSVLDQTFEAGDLLAEIVLAAGVLFDRPCAGRGTCGKCRMQVQGKLSDPSPAELKKLFAQDLAQGMRLSCQARALTDLEITVAHSAVITDKIFSAGLDLARISGDLGLAIDLGSTTVGAFLADLETGRALAGFAVLNRQTAHGAEIISRLALAEREPETLANLARASIHEAVAGLQLPAAALARIRRAVLVGNTAMHHLLLGLPVENLVRSPFTPAQKEARSGPGSILGNGFPSDLQVRFPPLIGGFVGSDALACLLYFGFDQVGAPEAALDLGTNGEVMLTDGKRILAASAAAGPAFEGINIACGMRALPGAIVRAFGKDGGLELETLAGVPAQGIAGSGLISLAPTLRGLGYLAGSGNLTQPSPVGARHALPLRLEGEGKARKLWLTEQVYLSQSDVRELQKAKAAVRAALDILLQKLSLKPQDLRRVILTGSFGGRVPVEDALALGLLPRIEPVRVKSIPNGAGLGAALMLRQNNFKRAEKLARRAEHVELNRDPEFQERFIQAMALP